MADPGETPRNRRQEETFRKVLTAGMEMLRESSYADLTVRAVAARAKVAPATAYTYFSSKNHLIAEVYLDLIQQAPYFTDVNETDADRVETGAAQHGTDRRRRTRGGRGVHHGADGAATIDACAACATASAPRSTAASRSAVRPRCRPAHGCRPWR